MRNYSRGGGLRGRAGMRFKPIPKAEFYRPMRVVVKRVSKHRNSIWGDYENGTSLAHSGNTESGNGLVGGNEVY